MSASQSEIQFNQLEQWLCSNTAISSNLNDVENTVEIDGRELLRQLLQEHLDKRGLGDVGKALSAQNGTVLYVHRRMDCRKIMTVFGQITIHRIGYYCNPLHSGIHPLDEQLQLPQRSYSYELQRRIIKMAVQSTFGEAAQWALETMGQKVPKRSIQDLLIDASIDFDDFYVAKSESQRVDNNPIIVAAVDCKGIPMVKAELAKEPVRRRKGQKAQTKKMATVAAVYTMQPFLRTVHDVIDSLFHKENKTPEARKHEPRCQNKRIWASLLIGKDAFIKDVAQEVARRKAAQNRPVVVVTDGERALQIRISRVLKNVTLILDLAHVLEKLWKVAHVFHADGSVQAQQFVLKRTEVILNGKVGQVVKGLRSMVTKNKLKAEKSKTVLGVCKYLYRNRSRMNYVNYLTQGVPIASGAVEGACKNLIADRMERSGMRWTKRMAEAMVKIRALYLSGDFDEYWKYHISKEQKRLHLVRWIPFPAK